MKSYWLVKSEGSCYSIDDLKHDKKAQWTGVRNFQARNFMRDMKVGDEVLFYHSSSEPSGVFGIARVAKVAHADLTAQDKKDEHFDPRATKANPIWICPDLSFVAKLKRPVTLAEIKLDPKTASMAITQKGSRLSVSPLSEAAFKRVVELGGSSGI